MRVFITVLLFFLLIPNIAYSVDLPDPNQDAILMWYDAGSPNEEQFSGLGKGLHFDGSDLYATPTLLNLGDLNDSNCSVTSGPCTLLGSEVVNTVISTYGWNGVADCIIELPTATPEGKVTFMMGVTDANSTVFIDPQATDKIYRGTIAQADGERIALINPTIPEAVVCKAFTVDGSTYDWACYPIEGDLTNGG